MHNVVYILTLLLAASGTAVNFDFGTRDIVWQLATLSVQLYFPCTPSPQGVERSTAAANPLGLSQSPFPLFLPQVLFSH